MQLRRLFYLCGGGSRLWPAYRPVPQSDLLRQRLPQEGTKDGLVGFELEGKTLASSEQERSACG